MSSTSKVVGTLDFQCVDYFKENLNLTYTIRDFGSIWTANCNPNLKEISSDAYQWAGQKLKLTSAEITLTKIDGTARHAAFVYPRLNESGLLQAAKMTIFLSAWDSTHDLTPESIEAGHTSEEATLKGCLGVIEDFKCNLELSSNQKERWDESVQSYIETVADHKWMRQSGKILSISAYADFRVRNSLAQVFFLMGERLGNIQLSGDQLNHPDVLEMVRLFILFICFVNDVCSFRVEYLHGCLINLIPVVMAQTGFKLQAAFDYSNDVIIQIQDEIQHIETKIMENFQIWSPGMKEYMQLLQDFASGNTTFDCGSGRFHSVEDFARTLPIVMKLN